jgi:hypothetical protein
LVRRLLANKELPRILRVLTDTWQNTSSTRTCEEFSKTILMPQDCRPQRSNIKQTIPAHGCCNLQNPPQTIRDFFVHR